MSEPGSMQVLPFKSAAAFRCWLEKNHAKPGGVWVRFFKKNSSEKSLTYAEALDQALCYGWIDGQTKPFDEFSWLRKFTPRSSRSAWSKINTQHVERLTKAGAMAHAGLAAVKAAQSDGRWATAYDSPKNAKPPEDFLQELAKNEKAKVFFESLNRVNIYSIVYRLQTARKPELREKRMKMILAMMEEGRKFHP